jgi:hypothetical protein
MKNHGRKPRESYPSSRLLWPKSVPKNAKAESKAVVMGPFYEGGGSRFTWRDPAEAIAKAIAIDSGERLLSGTVRRLTPDECASYQLEIEARRK